MVISFCLELQLRNILLIVWPFILRLKDNIAERYSQTDGDSYLKKLKRVFIFKLFNLFQNILSGQQTLTFWLCSSTSRKQVFVASKKDVFILNNIFVFLSNYNKYSNSQINVWSAGLILQLVLARLII
jgi:hypothetical protein